MPVMSICGQSLAYDLPYAPGHPLTDGEASALNAAFAEAIRNRFRAVVEKGDKSPEQLQESFNELTARFRFQTRINTRSISPLEAEAAKLAELAIKRLCREKKTPLPTDMDEAVRRLLASDPSFAQEAAKRVAARNKLIEETLEI